MNWSPRDNFIQYLQNAGYEYDSITKRGQCPAHGGEGFNLAINESEYDGNVLLSCHSHGCSGSNICQAIGLAESDLFAPPEYREKRKREAKERTLKVYGSVQEVHDMVVGISGMKEEGFWDYFSEDNVLIGRVVRLANERGKQFRQLSLTEGGWAAVGMSGKRPLYNLPAVKGADTVIVCEGEKACDAITAAGYVATTSSQGSKSASKTDWAPLRRKKLIILPDNDDEGHNYVKAVRKLLPLSSEWKVMHLSSQFDMEAGGDAADIEPNLLSNELEGFLNGGEIVEQYTPPAELQAGRFSGKTAGELWEASVEEVDWMVEDVFASGQPTIFGAKQKSLKTTLLSDLVVALATQTPWLGKFEVPKKRKVLFITGESSARGAMKRIRQAIESRGMGQYDTADNLRIETDLFPSLSDDTDMYDLKAAVEDYDIDTVVVDPLYMGLGGINTSNLFEVGPALRKVKEMCGSADLILSHHVKKGSSDQIPSLEDLSQAGIAEFAGNYWMMGRLKEYKGKGSHDLGVRIGGRDDQFGLYHMHFKEETWTADFMDFDEWTTQQKEGDKVKKEIEEEEAYESRKSTILEFARSNGPFTSNGIDPSGKSRKVLDRMVADGIMAKTDKYVDDAGKKHRGVHYKLTGQNNGTS